MAVGQRTTKRKALVEKILTEDYSGGPALLEELRWKVLVQQYGLSFVDMTVAKWQRAMRVRQVVKPTAYSLIISRTVWPLGIIGSTCSW